MNPWYPIYAYGVDERPRRSVIFLREVTPSAEEQARRLKAAADRRARRNAKHKPQEQQP